MQQGVITLQTPPAVFASACIGGGKEHAGPLGEMFDAFDATDTFDKPTWEQSESELQRRTLCKALSKAGLAETDVDILFAGDLINQCTGSAYGLLDFDIPFVGLYGACSTSAEGLALAALLSDKFPCAAVVTSSHNCAAERQFRFPIEYGGQRPPTAQWTVTAAGAFLVSAAQRGPRITEVLLGRSDDSGITDVNNMGAAMATAAADTLCRFFRETKTTPQDYDHIATGDLGAEGSSILRELLATEHITLGENYQDCGVRIYDRERQDMHAGGSGCGCGASVLAGDLLPRLSRGELKNVLYVATGALMSATSVQQGLAIPGIAHLLHLTSACKQGGR